MQSNPPKHEKAEPAERKDPEGRDAMVGEQVMHSLGRPANLQRVQARRLWGDYYRVNVFVGESMACAKVVNSFFVRIDSRGHILTTDPVIAKQSVTP